jgi:hypothetical protein
MRCHAHCCAGVRTVKQCATRFCCFLLQSLWKDQTTITECNNASNVKITPYVLCTDVLRYHITAENIGFDAVTVVTFKDYTLLRCDVM